MVIVADTGPLLYLFLINQIELLPRLYGTVTIPSAVAQELSHDNSPPVLRSLLGERPSWLRIDEGRYAGSQWGHLDMGEREALALALRLRATLILTDDSAGRAAALAIANLRVAGTIGVLYQAALERRFLDTRDMASAFDAAIFRLRATNFYFTSRLDAAIDDLSLGLHERENQFL